MLSEDRRGYKESLERIIEDKTNLYNSKYTRENWIILINGKRIKFGNGKSLWNKKNHAKIALTHHVKYEFEHVLEEGGHNPFHEPFNELYKKLMDELEEEGVIEYRRVD